MMHTHECGECGGLIGCVEGCGVRRRTFWGWLRQDMRVGEERVTLCLECAHARLDRLLVDVERVLGEHGLQAVGSEPLDLFDQPEDR